jgi:hypothetical protein
MIFSHMQKPIGMRKTRVGMRISVHRVPFYTTWFCPYCCATVDTVSVAPTSQILVAYCSKSCHGEPTEGAFRGARGGGSLPRGDTPPPPVTQPCGRCRSSDRSCGARRRPHVVPAIGEVGHLVVSLDTYIEPAQCGPLFTRTSPTQTYHPKEIAALPIWRIHVVRIVLSHLGLTPSRQRTS